MEKINWNSEEDFLRGKTFIVCVECGWLVTDPRVSDGKDGKVNDDRCPNCGKLYKETNSEIGKIK